METENKKTIKHLNTKVWYRTTKVIFIFAFIIVLGIFNTIVFSGEIKKVDNEKTTVQCNVKDKQIFTAQELNLSLSKNDFMGDQFNYKKFFGGFNDYDIKSILTACNPKVFVAQKVEDIYDVQKGYEILGKTDVLSIDDKEEREKKIDTIMENEYLPYKNQTSSLVGSSKLPYLDFSFKIFDIKPIFTYNSFLKLFLIGNAIIFAVFEIIRRAFYYIASGTINPKAE